MSIEYNDYGFVSGGSIFDYMDKKAHKIAVDNIGDCVTASAYIHFFKPIKDLQELELKYDIHLITDSSIILQLNLVSGSENYCSGNFTFIRIK